MPTLYGKFNLRIYIYIYIYTHHVERVNFIYSSKCLHCHFNFLSITYSLLEKDFLELKESLINLFRMK